MPASSRAVQQPRGLFTSGALQLWTSVFAMLWLFAWSLPPRINQILDFRPFYTAGAMLIHQPSQLFNLAAQIASQTALVGPAPFATPYYHPSFEALLFAPFAFLSYRHAYFTWLALNMLLLAVCLRLAPPAASTFIRRWPRTLLFLAPFPVVMCLIQGQDSILFFLILCFVWRSLEAGEEVRAGALLALALFKPHVALLIALLLAVRLGGRFLKGFVPVAAVVVLTCIALTGITGFIDFLHLLRIVAVSSDSSHRAQWTLPVWPRDMPSLYGLLYMCGTRFLSPHAAFAINAVASASVLGASIYLVRKAHDLATVWSIAICCALMLGQHLYIYDFTLLLFPVLLLSGRMHRASVLLFYVLPYALFLIHGLDWLFAAAIVPFCLLYVCAPEDSEASPFDLPHLKVDGRQ